MNKHFKSFCAFGAILICGISSCANFLDGAALKSEVDSLVEEAAKNEVKINIFANNSHGTLTGEKGGTYKAGSKNLTLDFIENEAFQFVEWVVTDSQGKICGCTSSDKIFIANPYSSKTIFSVLEADDNYKIEAVCCARPKINLYSPSYISNGVNFDSDIEVYFAQPVDLESFIFSKEEAEAFGKHADYIYSSSDGSSQIAGILLADSKFFKNVQITDSNGTGIEKHFNPPVLSADRKKLTISIDTAKLIDFGSASVKDIFVSISKDVSYTYTNNLKKSISVNLGTENFEYNYRITQNSIAKAKVTFNEKNDDGMVVGSFPFNGQQSYNIGQNVLVDFTPADDYKFLYWKVSGNENEALVIDEQGTSISFYVANDASDIVITPVCELKGKVNISVRGVNSDVTPLEPFTKNVGDTFTLNVIYDSEYQFTGWKAINMVLNEEMDAGRMNEYFECENWTDSFVTVKVLKPFEQIRFEARCYEKPRVITHFPVNSNEGSNRDQNVKIYFDHDLSPDCIYFTDEEIAQLKQSKNLKDSDFITSVKNSSKKVAYVKDGEKFYKNMTIRTRSGSGESFSNYYGEPYFMDAATLIVPVVKEYFSDGTIDTSKLPPPKREVLFRLGTAFGYYEGSDFVPLSKDSNLTWFYTTNSNVDTTKPEFTQLIVKGNNSSGEFNVVSVTSKPSTAAKYKACYLNDNILKLDIKTVDMSKNLLSLTLIAQRVVDENFNDVSESSQLINLPFEINDTEGTYNADINLRNEVSKDGLYQIYFKVQDEVNNSAETIKYYVFLDKTAPSINLSGFKMFNRYKHIMIKNWDVQNVFDFVKTEVYFGSTLLDTITDKGSYRPSDSSTGKIYAVSGSGKVSFKVYDFSGNVNEYKDISYSCGEEVVKNEYLYLNKWFSPNYYSDETAFAVAAGDKNGKLVIVHPKEYSSTNTTLSWPRSSFNGWYSGSLSDCGISWWNVTDTFSGDDKEHKYFGKIVSDSVLSKISGGSGYNGKYYYCGNNCVYNINSPGLKSEIYYTVSGVNTFYYRAYSYFTDPDYK